jgi:hypothetical protein
MEPDPNLGVIIEAFGIDGETVAGPRAHQALCQSESKSSDYICRSEAVQSTGLSLQFHFDQNPVKRQFLKLYP